MTVETIQNALLGLSEKAAISLCHRYFYTYRLVKRDNMHYAITDDYDPLRINVEIENDRVTKTSIG